jgi:hypothetical protein
MIIPPRTLIAILQSPLFCDHRSLVFARWMKSQQNQASTANMMPAGHRARPSPVRALCPRSFGNIEMSTAATATFRNQVASDWCRCSLLGGMQ